LQQETEQNELTVPDPVARSSSLTPSEDYVIIDDGQQEKPAVKPAEEPVEQGLLKS
jgi:hypothetical protein